jgi:hypothetical protein
VRAVTDSQAQIPETAGLVNFLQGTRHQVADACNMLDQELRSRAHLIRAGTCKITIQRPAKATPETLPKPLTSDAVSEREREQPAA